MSGYSDEVARWLADALPPLPPGDVVAPRRHRPPREVVARLLALDDGTAVDVTEHRVLEDVDGIPAGVESTTTRATMLRPTLEQLGWTAAEWADPEVVE